MIKKGIKIFGAKVLLLGITFKENCPDVRNTKIIDVVKALESYSISVTIYDPWANPEDVLQEYGLITTNKQPKSQFDAVVLGVSHKEFLQMNLQPLQKETVVVYDVKGVLTSPIDGKL